MYKIIKITGPGFCLGFCLANYLNNGLFDLKPLKAKDLVPITQRTEIKQSSDDLIISTSRVNEIMKHGYPSLDNLRIFDDYVLSYDRRLF